VGFASAGEVEEVFYLVFGEGGKGRCWHCGVVRGGRERCER
jgi:hypothetical protein